jgi:CO/xanthine dehydrogenase Mo-binding subunit
VKAYIAHARVVRIETSRAAAVPGVIAVGEQMIYDDVETPTPVNPLGAKGCGEAGTIGCTPAVVNTVLDALAPLGATHLDMPLTPARVWAAIQAARTGRSS